MHRRSEASAPYAGTMFLGSATLLPGARHQCWPNFGCWHRSAARYATPYTVRYMRHWMRTHFTRVSVAEPQAMLFHWHVTFAHTLFSSVQNRHLRRYRRRNHLDFLLLPPGRNGPTVCSDLATAQSVDMRCCSWRLHHCLCHSSEATRCTLMLEVGTRSRLRYRFHDEP